MDRLPAISSDAEAVSAPRTAAVAASAASNGRTGSREAERKPLRVKTPPRDKQQQQHVEVEWQFVMACHSLEASAQRQKFHGHSHLL